MKLKCTVTLAKSGIHVTPKASSPHVDSVDPEKPRRHGFPIKTFGNDGLRNLAFAGMTAILFILNFPAHPFAAPSIPPLDAEHEEEAMRWMDQSVAQKSKDPAATAAMAAALRDDESPVKIRERAAWALGQLEAKPYSKDLVNALHDKGLLVRFAALDALFHMRSYDDLPALIQIATDDPVLIMRQRATAALGFLSSEKTITTLVKLSSDSREEIRGTAALAMAATQSKKNDFSEALKEMATTDSSPYVQDRAKVGLDMTGKKTLAMRKHLASPTLDVRFFSALYFHQHGTSKDLKTLGITLSKETNDEVRYELGLAQTAIKNRAKAAKKSGVKKSSGTKSSPTTKQKNPGQHDVMDY